MVHFRVLSVTRAVWCLLVGDQWKMYWKGHTTKWSKLIWYSAPEFV